MISAEEREQIIQQTSQLGQKLIDLDDQLKDGVPYARMKKIREHMQMLEDLIFYNQELLEIGLDNE